MEIKQEVVLQNNKAAETHLDFNINLVHGVHCRNSHICRLAHFCTHVEFLCRAIVSNISITCQEPFEFVIHFHKNVK